MVKTLSRDLWRSQVTARVCWVVVALAAVACGSEAGQAEFAEELGIDMDAMTHSPSGLAYQDLTVGDGPEAVAGSTVTVHYTGWLPDGTRFDSSREGEPFHFTLGGGEVIAGWDEGVAGMRVGGKRKLVLPPELGYGRYGSPPVIPPDATLVFEVELLAVN
jgi:FKBP-type peptidyl-prolyl cis-trans isomerase FkpA